MILILAINLAIQTWSAGLAMIPATSQLDNSFWLVGFRFYQNTRILSRLLVIMRYLTKDFLAFQLYGAQPPTMAFSST